MANDLTVIDRWLARTRVRFVSGFRHALALGVACPSHAHATIELVYHPTGRGHTDVEGDGRWQFAEGDVVVYAPGAVHDQTMSRAGEDWCVHVSTSQPWPAAGRRCVSVGTSRTMQADLAALSSAMRPECDAARRALDARALAMLYEVLRQRPAATEVDTPSTYAARARGLVLRDYASVPDIAALALALGISGDYLRHLFRAEYGQSLGQFLIETRLQRAKEMLQFSRVPLKTIVAACGFDNDRYFCTAFRRRFGCTPTEYRVRETGQHRR